MSETAEDRDYYAAAEAAFIRRRGTPFLLSPRDFALLKEWHALGVPLEAVESGIDDAFTRREERGVVGRVNSLRYCRDAVLEAWERLADTARGRGRADAGEKLDAAASLARLAERLDAALARRPDLTPTFSSARRALERLRSSSKSAEQIEASLARLDRRLAKEVLETLPDAERAELEREVAHRLGSASDRMDSETLEKTTRALRRRFLRERLDLPRLSLL